MFSEALILCRHCLMTSRPVILGNEIEKGSCRHVEVATFEGSHHRALDGVLAKRTALLIAWQHELMRGPTLQLDVRRSCSIRFSPPSGQCSTSVSVATPKLWMWRLLSSTTAAHFSGRIPPDGRYEKIAIPASGYIWIWTRAGTDEVVCLESL